MEVIDAHCSEDGDYYVVVSEVGVERSAKREIVGVVGERAVNAAVTCSDVLVIQAGKQLLEVAETLCAAGWIAKAIVVYTRLAGCLQGATVDLQ